MLTTQFLDIPPLQRRRRHGARCRARRASPTACCCSPACAAGTTVDRTTCSTPTTPASCSTRCAQLGCGIEAAPAPAHASPASAAGRRCTSATLLPRQRRHGDAAADRGAGAASPRTHGGELRAARRAAHARAADRRPGRRAARARLRDRLPGQRRLSAAARLGRPPARSRSPRRSTCAATSRASS